MNKLLQGQGALNIAYNQIRSRERFNASLADPKLADPTVEPQYVTTEEATIFLDTVQECFNLLREGLMNGQCTEPAWSSRVQKILAIDEHFQNKYFQDGDWIPVAAMIDQDIVQAISNLEDQAYQSLAEDKSRPFLPAADPGHIAEIIQPVYWLLRKEALRRALSLKISPYRPDMPDTRRTKQGVAAEVEELRALIFDVVKGLEQGRGVKDTWLFSARIAIGLPADVMRGGVCFADLPGVKEPQLGRYIGYGLAIVPNNDGDKIIVCQTSAIADCPSRADVTKLPDIDEDVYLACIQLLESLMDRQVRPRAER